MWFFRRPVVTTPVNAPHPWTKVSVLHKYTYVQPSMVVDKIETMHDVCTDETFLDCMVAYNEVTELTKAFAFALDAPEMEDPETFRMVFRGLLDASSELSDIPD
jgi:hypothetical protein